MFLTQPDPIAFRLLGVDIRWYGVLITVGILLGLLLAFTRADRYRVNRDHLINVILLALPLGIIGARFYYVLFNWSSYASNPIRVLYFREGGLAIHGGLLFGLTAALVGCAIWKLRPLTLFDLVAPSIALAQSIGRWGNYFNQEAHGGPTNLPWAIPVGGEMVHPTFLYESIWCLLLCLVLLGLSRRQAFEGQIFLLYGILYSFERFFVEGLRTDSLMIGSLRMAQAVSALIFFLFLIIYIILAVRARRTRHRIFYRN